MNTKLTFLILLISITTIGQVDYFLKASVDPKMLSEGPHDNNDKYSDSSLDLEIQWGVEFKNFRVSQAYQSHKEINYSKYTWLMVDYMLKNFPLKNINCYAGIEGSSITRKFPDASFDQPKNFRDSQTSMWHYGVNAEIQWMIFKNVGISSHLNLFRAEPALTRYGKEYRWEVMTGLIFKTK